MANTKRQKDKKNNNRLKVDQRGLYPSMYRTKSPVINIKQLTLI